MACLCRMPLERSLLGHCLTRLAHLLHPASMRCPRSPYVLHGPAATPGPAPDIAPPLRCSSSYTTICTHASGQQRPLWQLFKLRLGLSAAPD